MNKPFVQPPAVLDIKDIHNIDRLNDPDVKKGFVYFLYCAGHVKIGITTPTRLAKRFTELQIGSPHASQMILLLPGGRSTELFIHFAFAEYRVGGEWFVFAEPIRNCIAEFAPEECKQWLAKEEASYKAWIRQEAISLGLLKDES